MSIRLIENGDIFASKMEVWVNPVNCVGVMGAGLAKSFKRRFPDMDKAYVKACHAHDIQLGKIWIWLEPIPLPKYIVCFPTKFHWRELSQFDEIEEGLIDLHNFTQTQSVAIPALGCGLGGLEWRAVRQLIELIFSVHSADVEIYAPLA